MFTGELKQHEGQLNAKSKLGTSPFDLLMNKEFISSLENLGKRKFLDGPLKLSDENTPSGSFQEVLASEYAKEKDQSVEKCMAISILCYLKTKNKVAFPISKSTLEQIYLNDPNWENKLLFNKDTYKIVGRLLSKFNIIRIVLSTSSSDQETNISPVKHRPGIALALPGSPVFDTYTGNIDDELRQLFEQYELTINDIIEDYRDTFGIFFEVN